MRLLRFGLIGSTGVVVNAGLLSVMTEVLRMDYRISSLFAIECAIINNFTWNYLWTWRDRRPGSRVKIAAMFAKFNGSSGLIAFVVNYGLLVVLTEYAGLHYAVSNLIGIGVGTAANFAASHYWTFSTVSRQVLDNGFPEKT